MDVVRKLIKSTTIPLTLRHYYMIFMFKSKGKRVRRLGRSGNLFYRIDFKGIVIPLKLDFMKIKETALTNKTCH